MLEFYRLMGLNKLQPVTAIGLAFGASIFVLAFFVASQSIPLHYLLVLALFPPAIMITGLYSKNRDVIKEISAVFMAVFYVALPLAILNFLVFPQATNHLYTHRILLGILIMVWLNDTGAYVTGITMGHHKLFPSISPKKTWEGWAGGALFTLIPAFWMHRIMGLLTVHDWIFMAVVVCVFGVFGDLTESLIKRNAGIKDSGNLIPGHGGVLDRFDSLLFVVPVILVYLQFR